MRTILMTLTVLVMTVSFAVAQAPAKDGDGPRKHDKGQMVEKMKTDLDLTDDQVKKLEALEAKSKAERDEMNKENKEERQALQEKHKAEMKEILTKDQYIKLLELQNKRNPEHRDGKGKGDKSKDCSKECDHRKK